VRSAMSCAPTLVRGPGGTRTLPPGMEHCSLGGRCCAYVRATSSSTHRHARCRRYMIAVHACSCMHCVKVHAFEFSDKRVSSIGCQLCHKTSGPRQLLRHWGVTACFRACSRTPALARLAIYMHTEQLSNATGLLHSSVAAAACNTGTISSPLNRWRECMRAVPCLKYISLSWVHHTGSMLLQTGRSMNLLFSKLCWTTHGDSP
jgi:hypothetical protein